MGETMNARRSQNPEVRIQKWMIALVMVFWGSNIYAADERPADVKLEPIFTGKDLTGWTTQKPGAATKDPEAEKSWKVIDGVLVGENDDRKKGSMLWSQRLYKDVAIEADCRWKGEIDSGIMVRKPEVQVQIGVSRSLKKDMTASIYAKGGYAGKAQGVEKLLKEGDWNRIRIEAKGPVFKVWLNGQHVLTWESADYPNEAPIGLQIHGGLKMKVEFKDIKVAELK
jgi:hypothetical protein